MAVVQSLQSARTPRAIGPPSPTTSPHIRPMDIACPRTCGWRTSAVKAPMAGCVHAASRCEAHNKPMNASRVPVKARAAKVRCDASNPGTMSALRGSLVHSQLPTGIPEMKEIPINENIKPRSAAPASHTCRACKVTTDMKHACPSAALVESALRACTL
eukprot:CAMPEP_0182840922 /NCGR_PEP_ID=MMETSP0006_2-20121128/24737_1 /TAXON_ID=97485 /ORGANISM="Prymnesium parvum, Strain Texoma1" /LENGTH=158 /DNA_ID=CAMNT_0024970329 /DNA_START=180 /DNA_END=656 /DNA_ORIENTATION=+